MRIVILGSTGTTGTQVVDQALRAGHEAVAFARRPEAVPPRNRLTVARGSVEDLATMAAAFAGADAVISCVGIPMTPRIIFKGTDFQQRTLPLILSALHQAKVKRFVLMSSFGSGDTAEKASPLARIMIYKSMAKRMFDDKALAERALVNASANWTAVYPVTLKKGPAIASPRVIPLNEVSQVPGMPILPFANVATVLVELAGSNDHAGQRLLITTPDGWRPL
jgi:putative NADH-flavin reductase